MIDKNKIASENLSNNSIDCASNNFSSNSFVNLSGVFKDFDKNAIKIRVVHKAHGNGDEHIGHANHQTRQKHRCPLLALAEHDEYQRGRKNRRDHNGEHRRREQSTRTGSQQRRHHGEHDIHDESRAGVHQNGHEDYARGYRHQIRRDCAHQEREKHCEHTHDRKHQEQLCIAEDVARERV